jgi:uncharacterized membrane-anchored protein YhcB (DUF1043 family)
METTSFVLGMSSVVVIALAVVAVVGFFKARKTEKELERTSQDLYLEIEDLRTDINRRVDELESNTHSQLDSRLDKLESRLMDTIKNGCDPVKNKK